MEVSEGRSKERLVSKRLFNSRYSARHLQDRSWQGLEKRIGETTVGGVVKGRSGIPSRYSNEKDRLRIN